MPRSGHVQSCFLIVAALLATLWLSVLSPAVSARTFLQQQTENETEVVRVHWAARPGVTRYRLQLAQDASFNDIVFDGVVTGTEYQVSDLPAGRYFWRVAPLASRKGPYSSTGVIDVRLRARPSTQTQPPSVPLSAFKTTDGWGAAVGEVACLELAHLRSPATEDILGVSVSGATFALDAKSGVALWTLAPLAGETAAAPIVPPLLVQSPSGVATVLIVRGVHVRLVEGEGGREISRVTLPAIAARAALSDDGRSAWVAIVDSSLRSLLVLNAQNGSVIARAQLSGHVVAEPVALEYKGSPSVMLAYEDGRLEIRDRTTAIIASTNTASANTTGPLFVMGKRNGLIMVGTKSGLTALDQEAARVLGRVALVDDAPRGSLLAADLDSDGEREVIMTTERDRIVVVHASDGRTVWESARVQAPQAIAFGDINSDHVEDLLVSGRAGVVTVLSGKDGSILWQSEQTQPGSATTPHGILALRTHSGMLIITTTPAGVRAIGLVAGNS